MLREILRKMSKEDSNVRLKSLEQVLQLGQNIVQQDVEEKKKKQIQQQGISSPVSLPTSPILANMPPVEASHPPPAPPPFNLQSINSNNNVRMKGQAQPLSSSVRLLSFIDILS